MDALSKLDGAARIAAASALSFLADPEGGDALAEETLRLYLVEQMPLVGPMMAMQRLVSGCLGVAIAACPDPERYREIAAALVLADGQWSQT